MVTSGASCAVCLLEEKLESLASKGSEASIGCVQGSSISLMTMILNLPYGMGD